MYREAVRLSGQSCLRQACSFFSFVLKNSEQEKTETQRTRLLVAFLQPNIACKYPEFLILIYVK